MTIGTCKNCRWITPPRRNGWCQTLAAGGAGPMMVKMLMLSVVIAVAGIIANLFIGALAGAAITVTGLGGVTAFAFKVTKLARDQSMLKLVPARYELAISVCPSEACIQRIISCFIQETRSDRK
ncbi:MAG: hypothetical protein GY862_07530 [Gammaproteobacteria bacterium]|nr:hypothetical protein [Gammaproteobacteria bacterium]